MSNRNLNEFKVFMKKPEEEKEVNKTIIAYTRVSSKQQQSNFSLQEQQREIREYAKNHNLTIVDTFGEKYESASSDFTRKEFQRLIKKIKMRKDRPYAVAIKFINRFSRTGDNAIAIVMELVDKYGVHLIETSSGLTTETFDGRMAIYSKLLEARKENHERLKKTIPGMRAFLMAGNWLGNAPYGYTIYGKRVIDITRIREKQEMVINKEGEVLKKAWQWKLQGERDCIILQKMADYGVVIRKQKLSDIWRKPVYCGVNTNSLLDEPLIGNWEAMISIDGFKKINQMLKPSTGGTYNTNSVNDDRPLARFLICEKCGTPLTGYIVRKKNAHYYKCNVCKGVNMNAKTTVRARELGLNDSFNQLLKGIELQPESARLFKKHVNKVFNHLNKDAVQLQSSLNMQLKAVDVKIQKLEDRYIYDGLEPEIYKRHLAKLEEEKATILSKCKNMNGDLSNHLVHLESVAFASQNLSKYWAMGSYPIKDRIQRAVFPRGLVIVPEKRQYLTKDINRFMLIRPRKSRDSEGAKKEKVGENTDLSYLVAGAGLEPTSGSCRI